MRLGIEPIGGLGNRLRFIDSSLAFAQKFNSEVTIYWRYSKALNCPFDLLFETSDLFKIVNTRFSFGDGGKFDRLYNILRDYLRVGICKNYKKKYFYTDILRLRKENYNFESFANNESLFIQSFVDFFPTDDNLVYIKPNKDILEKVSQIVKENFSDHTIGIHIRRTDNKLAIKHSPDSLFHSKIEEEIEKNPDVRFFLATDSVITENEFKNKYPDRIITLKKSLRRDSQDGIIDAFIDILCLSRTKTIYGSYYSSFSYYASLINKIELILPEIDD